MRPIPVRGWPPANAKVTVDDADIQYMRGGVLGLVQQGLTFMRDGIIAINVDYKARRGG